MPNFRCGDSTVVAGLMNADGSPLGFSNAATQPLSDSWSASRASATDSPPCTENNVLISHELRHFACQQEGSSLLRMLDLFPSTRFDYLLCLMLPSLTSSKLGQRQAHQLLQ